MVHLTYSLDFGGMEKHLEILARTAGDWEHRFCALTRGGASERLMRDAGASVTILDCRPPAMGWLALRRTIQHLRRERPDAVHCHGFDANIIGIAAARLLRVPVRIAEEIGTAERSAKVRLVAAAAYRLANRVIGVSNFVRDWLIASGSPRDRTVTLYNPVILPTAAARPRRVGEPLRIGFVGRLEVVKNPLALVEAVAELVADGIGVELLVVGEGSLRPAIERLVAGHGLAGSVELAGYVEQPAALLETCHVYAQPSLTEGFGIALVEAMACGLPALVTTTGGMVEIVEAERSGWFLDSPRAASIAALLRTVAALDREIVAAKGREAKASVASRFEPSHYVERIEALYADVAEHRTLATQTATMSGG